MEDNITRLENSLSSALERISTLEGIIREHRHASLDGSSDMTGDTEGRFNSINVRGGVISNGVGVVPSMKMVDSDYGSGGTTRARSGIKAIATLGKGTSSEQVRTISGVVLDKSDTDTSTQKESQYSLSYSPYSTDRAFFDCRAHPIITQQNVVVTNASNTLTFPNANWSVNELTGAILNVYSPSAILESHFIKSNSSNTVTLSNSETFSVSSGSYLVGIEFPVYLGSASSSWRRLYVVGTGEDGVAGTQAQRKAIRLGMGSSGGSQVIWIAYGTGSPEGVVTANVGSLFLRTDGGVGTTLYVKQTGTGNTGWAAK